MSARDLLGLAWQTVWHQRQRSGLTTLGIVIGIASVILLTSIGEGTRQYVLAEFTQFGTTLATVTPGRIETTGLPGALGITTHPLTLDDAASLERLPGVAGVVPVIVGTAPIENAGKVRHSFVYGVTAAVPEVWRMRIRSGRFLPPLDLQRGAPLAVLGPKLKRELFGDEPWLGRHVRVAGQRFLIIGIMAAKGQFLGFDIDDSVYIPVGEAARLFNRDQLHEIDVLIANASLIETVVGRLRATLMARHDREEDFTLVTQTGMLDSLGRIIRIISLAVVGIGAISLLVGSIGILTMMWISVNERTSEIGLAMALGATRKQILGLFLVEAALLSTTGGLLGLAAGLGLAHLIHFSLPGLPVHTPPEYLWLAVAVSVLMGLISGLLPARRAASLDPVVALATE